MPDIQINNHSSILIFVPRTETGMEWMHENLPSSAMRWAGGIVVEPRYAADIVNGAIEDGLQVEG